MKQRKLPLLTLINNPDFEDMNEVEKYGEAIWLQMHRRTRGAWTSAFSERITGEYVPPPSLRVVSG